MASYLTGSIPFALIFSRFKNIDIRKVGSGNIGATNVFRSVSKTLGVITFAADFLKGFLASKYIALMGCFYIDSEQWLYLALACGFAAIIGHSWSIFVNFKGGKGVAVSAGVLVAIAPLAALIGLIIWFIVFITSGYVSIASIIAAFILAIVSWFVYYYKQGVFLPVILNILAILICWRHKSNIQRLINGKEYRFNIWRRKK